MTNTTMAAELALLAAMVVVACAQAQAPQHGATGGSTPRRVSAPPAVGLLIAGLRPLALALASRYPENASQLREMAAEGERLTYLRTGYLLEILRRVGGTTTQYKAEVAITIHPSEEEAKKGLQIELRRYPIRFAFV